MTHYTIKKLPITCIIVNFNEALHLKSSLESILFCEEILFVDLGSTDESLLIAEELSCTIIQHERLMIVEKIRLNILNKAKNDWLLFIDPDEAIDKILQKNIIELMSDLPANIGMISVPWQFYFRGKILKGTIWGNINKRKTILFNRRKVDFPSEVHSSPICREGYSHYEIKRGDNNILHHYWMDNYSQFIEKHRRYLKMEGENRYKKGLRYSLILQIYKTITAFIISFFKEKGYLQGFTGFLLSLFYSWYVYKYWTSLNQYQKEIKNT